MESSPSAEFFSESVGLQFDALWRSKKSLRLRQSMKEEWLAPFCLHQDTITTAMTLREICIDNNSRTRGIQYRAQMRTLLPPAMQVDLANFSVNVIDRVIMGKCKPGKYVDI